MSSRQSPQTLAGWLERQESLHAKSIDLELSRVAAVARRLGVDQPCCPVVTVAGTNGKGSVVAHLDAMLRCGGVKAGVFTSPHLIRYNERICVDGEEATDAELVGAFERIEDARGDITLTYFEWSTLAALIVFAEREVDAAVLEVGLGGRLDATNIVDAAVAVVTSIGFDHRDWLGDTLEAIGREKAGILRRGRPAVLGSCEMPASVFEAIEAGGAQPVVAARDFTWHILNGRWSYRGPRWALDDLPPSALAGSIQYDNAATAIAALEAGAFAIGEAGIREGLRTVRLRGRLQIVPGPVEWIFDVAHNEPAARVLAMHLRERPCKGRTYAVVSILADKDIAAMGEALEGVVDQWILCSLDTPRGLTARQLSEGLDIPAMLAGSVAEGCERAKALAKPSDRIVVCGSFLTVGLGLQALGLY